MYSLQEPVTYIMKVANFKNAETKKHRQEACSDFGETGDVGVAHLRRSKEKACLN